MKTRHDNISHDESHFMLWKESMLHNLSEDIAKREKQRDYFVKIKADYPVKFLRNWY